MDLSKEYMNDLLVRLSHHSNAIENNTISLPETVSIILHNTIPNKISLRELYEIDNHRHAMEHLLSPETLEKDFSFDIMFQTHEILMNRLHHERGKFKTQENFIQGADFDTVHPRDVYTVMKQWLDNVNYRINLAETPKEIINVACQSHIDFERIHPFADGNGRTGRLIMNFLLMKKTIAPLIIEKEDKERYILFLANRDNERFTVYAEKKITKEQKRITAFSNQ